MTPAPRFLLAKYAPDLRRMEPRNIGVILWANGQLRSQFLSDSPDFVNDKRTYLRWKEFWEHEIAKKEIAPLRGQAVPVSDPACMDALLTMQEGNYMLVDAGELLVGLKKKEIESATSFLFERIVQTPVPPTSNDDPHVRFMHVCNSAIRSSGIEHMPGFSRKYKVTCPILGVTKPVQFSYGIGDDQTIRALYQRVAIDDEKSVFLAGLKYRELIESDRADTSQCVALIQSSAIARSTNGAKSNERLLKKHCTVIDVDDSAAPNRIRQIAG